MLPPPEKEKKKGRKAICLVKFTLILLVNEFTGGKGGGFVNHLLIMKFL